jgi:hypothetical protein
MLPPLEPNHALTRPTRQVRANVGHAAVGKPPLPVSQNPVQLRFSGALENGLEVVGFLASSPRC